MIQLECDARQKRQKSAEAAAEALTALVTLMLPDKPDDTNGRGEQDGAGDDAHATMDVGAVCRPEIGTALAAAAADRG